MTIYAVCNSAGEVLDRLTTERAAFRVQDALQASTREPHYVVRVPAITEAR